MTATKMGEASKYFNQMLLVETDECIEWKYSRDVLGYGKLKFNRKNQFVHRLSLELKIGKSPQDKSLALHKPIICHKPSCFNYRHLYWGDKKDNREDALVDGTVARGERYRHSKLTRLQVKAIRADTRFQRVIAMDYGINQQHVSSIKLGKSWSWLPHRYPNNPDLPEETK